MDDTTPEKSQPPWLKEMLTEMPWQPPKTWFKYHCPSCDHADWIEDIIVDAFPANGPGGTPILMCPNCHGTYLRDISVPETQSYTQPE